MQYDVVVIGGSYSGMAGALQLLQARRNVLIVDGGLRRNRMAASSRGYLSQDGSDPAKIVVEARVQLEKYDTLAWCNGNVTAIEREKEDFRVQIDEKRRVFTRRILFATGVSDTLPEIEGLAERWGSHIFHCRTVMVTT